MKDYELKPCPFCGGDAELCVHEATGVSWVRCIECETSGSASNAFCAVKAWNRRAERTCEVLDEEYDELLDRWETELSCGHMYHGLAQHVNYCPKCGAKVVE